MENPSTDYNTVYLLLYFENSLTYGKSCNQFSIWLDDVCRIFFVGPLGWHSMRRVKSKTANHHLITNHHVRNNVRYFSMVSDLKLYVSTNHLGCVAWYVAKCTIFQLINTLYFPLRNIHLLFRYIA